MKKRKKLFFLLIPVALILFFVLFIQIQSRTASDYFRDVKPSVYIPRGIADTYTDLLGFSIDEHKLWEYKLNFTEKNEIEEDLDNGKWNKITDETMPEIAYYFTVNSDSYMPDDISDDSYYCIYDFSLKRFIGIDEDVAILGWHRALFIFDKETSRYYCVSMSV